jgi:hypothetical protein
MSALRALIRCLWVKVTMNIRTKGVVFYGLRSAKEIGETNNLSEKSAKTMVGDNRQYEADK